ncbi:hypothetical protein [Scytonema hofmannii]|nr:hypothetical protein [Scytonema hofmannii]
MPKKADGFIVIARAEPASEPPTAIPKTNFCISFSSIWYFRYWF